MQDLKIISGVKFIALVCNKQNNSNFQRAVLMLYVEDMVIGQFSGVDNPDLFPSICAGHFTLHHFCNASGDHQSSYLT
jgi:hypothetical protein